MFFLIIAGVLVFVFKLKVLGIVICVLSVMYTISAAIFSKVFDLTMNLSLKILKLLLKRGKVISENDWKNVKRHNKILYKDLISKESHGSCYFYSRELAMCLKDAQLMYCAIRIKGGLSGHSVIVKDNCIYDTNIKAHYDYEEYIKDTGAIIYKIFSKKEYEKDSFYNDIRQGFVEWCKENNAYCNPE